MLCEGSPPAPCTCACVVERACCSWPAGPCRLPCRAFLHLTLHPHAAVYRRWLRENRHLKYMWLPYTDTVVVTQCNPLTQATSTPAPPVAAASMSEPPVRDADHVLAPLRALLRERGAAGAGAAAADSVDALTATELRDALLALDPLDPKWVARVNGAEAEYWKRCAVACAACVVPTAESVRQGMQGIGRVSEADVAAASLPLHSAQLTLPRCTVYAAFICCICGA